MATNRVYKDGAQLSLPVPAGTTSGTALAVGELPVVALTDEGGGGNAAGFATVQAFPSPVFEFAVTGDDGATAGGVAVGVGDPVFLQADGTINVNAAGTWFGYALAPVAAGATTTVRVKLAPGAA